jgi:hypothetical protein
MEKKCRRVIPKEDYAKLQEIRLESRKKKTDQNKFDFILKNIVECSPRKEEASDTSRNELIDIEMYPTEQTE